jgi:hypothetical protein
LISILNGLFGFTLQNDREAAGGGEPCSRGRNSTVTLIVFGIALDFGRELLIIGRVGELLGSGASWNKKASKIPAGRALVEDFVRTHGANQVVAKGVDQQGAGGGQENTLDRMDIR